MTFAACFKKPTTFISCCPVPSQFLWKDIIQNTIAELNPKYWTSYNILDSLQPYIRSVEGRKIALAVLRDKLLIII